MSFSGCYITGIQVDVNKLTFSWCYNTCKQNMPIKCGCPLVDVISVQYVNKLTYSDCYNDMYTVYN